MERPTNPLVEGCSDECPPMSSRITPEEFQHSPLIGQHSREPGDGLQRPSRLAFQCQAVSGRTAPDKLTRTPKGATLSLLRKVSSGIGSGLAATPRLFRLDETTILPSGHEALRVKSCELERLELELGKERDARMSAEMKLSDLKKQIPISTKEKVRLEQMHDENTEFGVSIESLVPRLDLGEIRLTEGGLLASLTHRSVDGGIRGLIDEITQEKLKDMQQGLSEIQKRCERLVSPKTSREVNRAIEDVYKSIGIERIGEPPDYDALMRSAVQTDEESESYNGRRGLVSSALDESSSAMGGVTSSLGAAGGLGALEISPGVAGCVKCERCGSYVSVDNKSSFDFDAIIKESIKPSIEVWEGQLCPGGRPPLALVRDINRPLINDCGILLPLPEGRNAKDVLLNSVFLWLALIAEVMLFFYPGPRRVLRGIHVVEGGVEAFRKAMLEVAAPGVSPNMEIVLSVLWRSLILVTTGSVLVIILDFVMGSGVLFSVVRFTKQLLV